ncbi:MAG: type VI secretion protein IcmF/TssM N-terminal domain-containing protein [Planctomycetota bacterium]
MNSFIRLIENALWPFRVIWSYASRFLRYGKMAQKGPAMSLAAKIAVAFFLGLATFITVMWIVGAFNERTTFHAKIVGYTFVDYPIYYLIALLLAVAVYFSIRMATREKPSLYPEIDRCWEPIEAWREKNSLAWNEFHRYLVLGADLETAKAMHAEMQDRKIGPLPNGVNEWMHWFGTNASAYLHLKKACHVSDRLERLSGKTSAASIDPTNTLQASVGVPDWSGSVGVDAMTEEVGYGDSMGDFGDSLDPAQSLDPYADDDDLPMQSIDTQDSESVDDEEEDFGEEGDTPSDRVKYVCQMIRSRTSGEMPLNGVVVVIPFDKFMHRENFKAITNAVKKDLLEIRNQLDIQFPVSFLFCSMEKDQGFPKLQNLLGAKRSGSGRFGAGCRISEIPFLEKSNLAIQVDRACQSFEDWVTNRWGKSSQLSRAAQNKELYKLVIRVRQQFRPRLIHLLQQSLLWSESEIPDEYVDLSLAGCYFASTGEHSAERGFLNGVFLKCDEFAETASWGERILNHDRFQSAMASLISVTGVVALVGVVVWMFVG